MAGSESTPTLRNRGTRKQCQALMSEQSRLKSAYSNAETKSVLPSSSRDSSSMTSKISSLLLCGLLAFGQGIPPAISDTVSPVFDEAKSLGSGQAKKIAAELSAFEEKTGWKIRVLTRDSRRQEQRATPQQIRELWKLPDDDAVVVILDVSNSNVLSFNSGAHVAKLLPTSFFTELTGRLGNIYAVRQTGEGGAAADSVRLIEACLERPGGCRYVPGIGEDQYVATVVGSLAGGVVFGFSALTALQFIEKKAKGSDAIFKFAPALFMPLWGTLYIGLGLNPLLQRQADAVLLLQNTGVFVGAALLTVAAWPSIARLEPPSIKL